MSHPINADDVVRQYYQLVDRGDLRLLDLFDTDATYKRPGYSEFRGHDQLRAFYSADRIIESGEHTIESLFVDGFSVGVEGVFAGTLRDGRTVTLAFSDFFDLQGHDGQLKIQHRRTYFDDQQV